MKSGWKSTEFWAGLFGVIIVYANEKLALKLDTTTIVSIVTMITGYIASRTVVKLKNGG